MRRRPGGSIGSVAIFMAAFLGALFGGSDQAAPTGEELIADRHVLIRQRVEPEGPVLVGQPVRVWVDVLTRSWFLKAPRFPDGVEVPRSIVIPPEAMGVNSSERVGRETYAVQSKAYTIFPQGTGRFEVPSIPVVVVVAVDGAKPSPPVELRTRPVVVEARLPEGLAEGNLVLSTARLTVTEQYSRPLEGLMVGDSFERRVTMTIVDAPAMLLPPFPFSADEGVAIYPDRPQLEDQRDRGQLAGTRVDSLTYVLEREGRFELPETSVPWWSLGASRLEHEHLPAVTLEVAPNPELAAEHLGAPDEESSGQLPAEPSAKTGGFDWMKALAGLIGVAVLLAAATRGLRRLQVKREADRDSEATFFRRFEQAAARGNPEETYRALMRWLDRLPGDGTPNTLRTLAARVDEDELLRETEALQRVLFARGPTDPGSWSGPRLEAAVSRARKAILHEPSMAASRPGRLPALNP